MDIFQRYSWKIETSEVHSMRKKVGIAIFLFIVSSVSGAECSIEKSAYTTGLNYASKMRITGIDTNIALDIISKNECRGYADSYNSLVNRKKMSVTQVYNLCMEGARAEYNKQGNYLMMDFDCKGVDALKRIK